MTMRGHRLLLLAIPLVLLGCRRGRVDAEEIAARPPAGPQSRGGQTASDQSSHEGAGKQPPVKGLAWTPVSLRKFVLETTLLTNQAVDKAYKSYQEDKVIGQCYGGAAVQLVKASEVQPLLQQRLGGHALQCYIASYFGCRVGDWLARAGIAQFGPGAVPFTESKVTILEQTADRVVADFVEAEPVDVKGDGTLDKDKTGATTDFDLRSRYTLNRDAQGTWRITGREPSFNDWECRER